MERNDLQGFEMAPKSIADYLTAKGGKNIYDEPNYRLVWSPNRRKLKGGVWHDWDRSLSANERGGLIRLESGLVIPSHYKADRIVTEVRSAKAYLFDPGWVLERWMPAVFYGNRADYEARVVPGTNIPFGGPFPVYGGYEMIHNCATEELPSITMLQNAMDRSDRTRETHGGSVQQIVLERINEAEWEYEEEQRKDKEEMQAFLTDLMSPIYGSSLAAGRHRTMLAEQQGIREHVGN